MLCIQAYSLHFLRLFLMSVMNAVHVYVVYENIS